MLRKTFLSIGAALLLSLGMTNQAIGAESLKKSRPLNILFILADDLGWRDLSNEGSRFYESPNIDSIARDGMKFTQSYSACSVCSPSRASILTGKYPPRHGITSYIGDPSGPEWRTLNRFTPLLPAAFDQALRPTEITLAEALHRSGYATFIAGKWHLGYDDNSSPVHFGFDINRGGWGRGSPQGGYFSPYENPALSDGPPGESLPLRLGRETAAFISEHKDQPFFAYLSFYSVHAPIQTTSTLWKKYRDKAVAAGQVETGKRFAWDRLINVREVQDCPIYAGMIESMDNAVGLVLARIKELGLEENTVVCFTSDNGGVSSGAPYATSNLPLRGGKGRQWEGGTRVPLYVRAPGRVQPGSTCATPVNGIDWYPTLLSLAGVPVPAAQAVDGVSLVPLLKGGKIPDRPLFWHFPHYANQGGEPSSIVLQDEWKLIHYYEDGRDELYHLTSDAGEREDLAQKEPGRAQTLRRQLDAWLKTTEAKFPTPDPEFDPVRYAARLKADRTTVRKQLESSHAHFLDPNFKPNIDWWKSELQGAKSGDN